MVIRMRHTRAHTGNRRSHHALKANALTLCDSCGQPKLPHKICANCGNFKGKKIASVTKKLDKKIKRVEGKNKSKK
jgi:large subunit ribosomal protein L32